MENLKNVIVKRLNEMESYTEKADCLETFELAFSNTESMNKELQTILCDQWDIINQMESN